jgi:ribosomal protein S18 acetylase RimI-like enzyme
MISRPSNASRTPKGGRRQPRTAESLRSWQQAQVVLVAVANGEIAGFLRGLSDGAVTTYVAELLVAPDCRGRGIAVALLDEAQQRFPSTRLDLLATAESSSFYERIGFYAFAGYRRRALKNS